MSELEIEDFKKFVANHKEIERMLDRSAYDLSDIVVDASLYSEKQDDINDKLGSLKKVTVSSKLSGGKDLSDKLSNLVDNYNASAANLIFVLEVSEKKIMAYNNGEDVDESVMNMFNQVMKGAADTNVFWIVNELTSRNEALASLGFLMAYGTDSNYEDANFVVGDTTKAVAEGLWPVLLEESKKRPFKHAAVGAGAVMILTGAQDVALDEGEMAVLDYARTGFDVVGAGANYANWVLVSSAVGGVPGILLASASTMAVAPMIDQFRDKAVGDNIIHTFTYDEDGKEYEVPKNGNGKDGTHDVLFERYAEANNDSHTLNKQTYTDYNYKSLLYRDWEELLPGGRCVYGDAAADQFNSYLQKIKESDDPSIVQECEKQLESRSVENMINDTNMLYNVLKQEDFNLQEYYDYYHGGMEK